MSFPTRHPTRSRSYRVRKRGSSRPCRSTVELGKPVLLDLWQVINWSLLQDQECDRTLPSCVIIRSLDNWLIFPEYIIVHVPYLGILQNPSGLESPTERHAEMQWVHVRIVDGVKYQYGIN